METITLCEMWNLTFFNPKCALFFFSKLYINQNSVSFTIEWKLFLHQIVFFSSTALKGHSQTKWSGARSDGKRRFSIRTWAAGKEPLIYTGTATVPVDHSGDSCMRETLFNQSVLSVLIQRICFIILISLASVACMQCHSLSRPLEHGKSQQSLLCQMYENPWLIVITQAWTVNTLILFFFTLGATICTKRSI